MIRVEDQTFKALTNLTKAEYENCHFIQCTFNEINLNNYSFSECIFEACDLSKFYNCSLQEVDFRGADLTDSTFDNCDFSASIFDGTILKNVNFRTSYNFSIDPSRNQLTKAKFTKEKCLGLLNHLKIEIK